MDRLIAFFVENTPSAAEWALWGPPSFLWALGALYLAGQVKRRLGVATGHTRKLFHFAIFFTVVALQWGVGVRAVCLFGAITTVVIAFALWRGSGNVLYEAMAREKDAPHRTLYIVTPYFATLIGGICSTAFFGPAAIVGFLVTGAGDAVGEPVGVRFGRHPYRVPAMAGVSAIRTVEGSIAVLVVSTAAAATAFWLTPELRWTFSTAWIVIGIGAAATVAEAVSPHGWDNATLQIIPAGLAYLAVG